MTKQLAAEQEYYAALQRLLDKKETVSLNAVAIEAGKKQGSLRSARFPDLVAEINRVIEVQEAGLVRHKEPKFEQRMKERNEELEAIKRDYHTVLQRLVSLERQVFELQSENSHLRKLTNNVHPFPKQV